MGTREGKAKEIIRAAIRVFSEHGFDGAKMEFIAKEAGVGKGTIYEYFQSKEQLFEEVLKYSVEVYSQGLKERIEQGETIEEKIVKCSMYSVEFIQSNVDIMQMAFKVDTLSKDMRAFHLEAQEAILQPIRDMIRTAIKEGEFRADLDEELATYCIMGALEQFCIQRVLCSSRPVEESDHRSIVDVLMTGLK